MHTERYALLFFFSLPFIKEGGGVMSGYKGDEFYSRGVIKLGRFMNPM